MASPLEGKIASAIHKGMKGIFLDATLTRDVAAVVSPAPDPWDPPAPTEVQTFTCKAIRDTFGVGAMAGGLVQSEDVKIILLQNSLATTPVSGDRITFDLAQFGGPFVIVPSDTGGQPAVSADPGNATWELRCRA